MCRNDIQICAYSVPEFLKVFLLPNNSSELEPGVLLICDDDVDEVEDNFVSIYQQYGDFIVNLTHLF